MATKTVAIPEEIHRLISEVQLDIRKECGISLNISYIVSQVLKTYTKDFAQKMKDGINTGVGNISVGKIQNLEKVQASALESDIEDKLKIGDDNLLKS